MSEKGGCDLISVMSWVKKNPGTSGGVFKGQGKYVQGRGSHMWPS